MFGRGFLVMALAAATAGCTAAPDDFADTGSRQKSPEQIVISRIMSGLGAVDPDEEPVSYQPRPPLVMPPRRDLPSPQSPDALKATAPNWPVDPDIAEREARRERYRNKIDPSKPWTPEELAKYRIEGAGQPRPERDLSKPLPPDELRGGRINVPKDEQLVDAAGAPVRRSLADPPVEYRRPSPNAPTELPEDEKPSKWAPSWWPF